MEMRKPEERSNEELWNSVSHGVGIPLAVVALVVGVVYASLSGDARKIVSVSVYGATLVFMYTASTVYHAATGKAKQLWNLLDHQSIFLLIAGSYTPITLAGMRGTWGWVLFGLAWGIALFGIVMKCILRNRLMALSTVLYLLMGWLVVIAARPLIHALPRPSLLCLLAGGLFYTVGVAFFAWRRPYAHFIWHLFVLAGSAFHFFAVLQIL